MCSSDVSVGDWSRLLTIKLEQQVACNLIRLFAVVVLLLCRNMPMHAGCTVLSNQYLGSSVGAL